MRPYHGQTVVAFASTVRKTNGSNRNKDPRLQTVRNCRSKKRNTNQVNGMIESPLNFDLLRSALEAFPIVVAKNPIQFCPTQVPLDANFAKRVGATKTKQKK